MATNENINASERAAGSSATSGSDQTFGNPEAVSKKDRMLILTIIIVLLVIAALAICGFLFIKQGPDTVQGQADATELRISGKLPGRVAEIFVEEGQKVKAGDTLVRIHSTLVDARLGQAQAMEQAASAANKKVDAGTRQQIISGARDLWIQAQAASGIAKRPMRECRISFRKVLLASRSVMRPRPHMMPL